MNKTGQRILITVVLVSICLLHSANTTQAASIQNITWRKNFRAATQEANRENKPMLVEVTAEWCGYCHKMFDQTFHDQRVIKHVNGCFIPVALDADENERIVEAIGIKALPTTVVISPELKILKKVTGYQTAAQLNHLLAGLCKRGKDDSPVNNRRNKRASVDPTYEFGQYCLVSMLDDRRLKKGSTEYTSQYRDKRVCFASPEQKERFDRNPARYWPAGAGTCPVTQQRKNIQRSGDPRMAVIYHGQLWFPADKKSQQDFTANPDLFDSKKLRISSSQ